MPRSLLSIFISATTRDLGSYRPTAADVLWTKKIFPVTQEHLGVDHRKLRELLHDEIGKCDAVICLVGMAFGTPVPGSGHPPRSYSQVEYDTAVELGKPIYVFLASEHCQPDKPPNDDTAGVASQVQHRRFLLRSEHKCETFSSRQELEELVALIDLQPPRSNHGFGLAAGALFLSVGWVTQSTRWLESGLDTLSAGGSGARGLTAWGELCAAELFVSKAWLALGQSDGWRAHRQFRRAAQLLKSVEPKLRDSSRLRRLRNDKRVQEFHRLLGFEFLRLAEARRLDDEQLSRFAVAVPNLLLDPQESHQLTVPDEYHVAIDHFNEVLRSVPDQIQARFGRAWATILGLGPRDLKSLQGSIQDLAPMLSDGTPYRAEAYFATGDAFRLYGQYQDAIKYYDGALTAAKDWGECWFRRGEARYQIRQYVEAIEDLTQAVRCGYMTATVFLYRGDAQRFQPLTNPLAAVGDYRQAIHHSPRQYNGHFGLGVTLRELAQQLPADQRQQGMVLLDEASRELREAAQCLAGASSKLTEVYRSLRAVEAERNNVAGVEECRQKIEELEAALPAGISPAGGLSRFYDLWPTIRLAVQDGLAGLEDRLAEFQRNTLADVDKWLAEEPANQNATYAKGLLLYKHRRWDEATTWFSKTIPLTSEPSEVYYARAMSLAQQGDWLGCIDDCVRATNRPRPYPQALWLKGRAYAALKDFDAAIACLELTCELEPTLPDVQYDLLWTLAQKERWPDLITRASLAIVAGVHNAAIYTARAEAYRHSKEGLEQALADCAAALAKDPQYSEALRMRGQVWLQQGLYDHAAAQFDYALSVSPNDPWLYCYRSEARRLLRQFDEALADAARAIELSDRCALAYFDKGWTHLDRQWQTQSDPDLTAAEAAFRQLIEVERLRPAGYTGLAEVHRRRQQTEEALQRVVEALTLAPHDALTHQIRGWINFDRRDWAAAQLDFSRSLEADPSSSYAYYGRAECERLQARWNEALWDFNKAITHDSRNGWARLMRGHVRREMKDYRSALEDFFEGARSVNLQGQPLTDVLLAQAWCRFELEQDEAALNDCVLAAQYQPKNIDTYQTWAAILHNIGRYPEALEKVNRCLELDPKYAPGYELRGVTWCVVGNRDEALADAERALKINPTDPNTMDLRAWARNRKGQFDDAIEDCAAGLLLDPSNPFLYCNLALARLGTGARAPAADALRKLLDVQLRDFSLSVPPRTRAANIGWLFTAEDWTAAHDRTGDPLALIGRGTVRWFAGQLPGAINDLDEALLRDTTLDEGGFARMLRLVRQELESRKT